jgi:hypothetical protein
MDLAHAELTRILPQNLYRVGSQDDAEIRAVETKRVEWWIIGITLRSGA